MKPIVGTQLVREHPLARGLVNAWLLNEGDGLRAGDSVARIRGVGDVGVSTAVQWGGGKPARFNGSTSRFRITASPNLANTSASSIFAVVTSFATAYDGVIFSKGSDGSGAGWGHILAASAGGFNGAVVTSGQTNCIGGTVAVGKQTAVCSTWRGDTRALRLFQDGVLVQSATSASATLRYANDSAIGTFFGSGYAVSSLFNGIIHCVFRWNRALEPDEVDALSADPYQMFDRSPASGIWIPSLNRSAVQRNAVCAWNLRSNASRLAALHWNTRQHASRSALLAWSMRNQSIREAALAWSVRQLAQRSALVAWNVRSQVSVPAQVQWMVRASVSNSPALVWDVRAVLQRVAAIDWHVGQSVALNAGIGWSARALAQRSADVNWSVRAQIHALPAITWKLAGIVRAPAGGGGYVPRAVGGGRPSQVNTARSPASLPQRPADVYSQRPESEDTSRPKS